MAICRLTVRQQKPNIAANKTVCWSAAGREEGTEQGSRTTLLQILIVQTTLRCYAIDHGNMKMMSTDCIPLYVH